MISPGLSSCEHTLNTLRYADRVKELSASEGGGGGGGGGGDHDEPLLNDDDGNDLDEDHDLQLVQSRNVRAIQHCCDGMSSTCAFDDV